MLILMEEGARTIISFFIRVSIPENIVDPPDCTGVRRVKAAEFPVGLTYHDDVTEHVSLDMGIASLDRSEQSKMNSVPIHT